MNIQQHAEQIAEQIAERIDLKSQEEIEAIMVDVCSKEGFEMRSLYPRVSNAYAKLTPAVLKSSIQHCHREAEAR